MACSGRYCVCSRRSSLQTSSRRYSCSITCAPTRYNTRRAWHYECTARSPSNLTRPSQPPLQVRSLEEFAGWQRTGLVKILGLSNAVAAKLHHSVHAEAQFAQGRSLVTAVLSHRTAPAGHIECALARQPRALTCAPHPRTRALTTSILGSRFVVSTTVKTTDGRRGEYSVARRYTAFRELHVAILPKLVPLLHASFPAPKVSAPSHPCQ
jgi:hypothetical protein